MTCLETGFGDPEHDVLTAALEAVSPPPGAMIPAAAIEAAIAEAFEMVAANRADEAELAGLPGGYGAGQAACGQLAMLRLFQSLLLATA